MRRIYLYITVYNMMTEVCAAMRVEEAILSGLRIELTYQLSIFHIREIFMFYCPSNLFDYCP